MPSPGTEYPTAATGYDSFAAAYARADEPSLHDRCYGRPAMVRLAGDVEGHRVLDAGCGSGPWAPRCSGRRSPTAATR